MHTTARGWATKQDFRAAEPGIGVIDALDKTGEFVHHFHVIVVRGRMDQGSAERASAPGWPAWNNGTALGTSSFSALAF
jgi:hypothetical protein